MSIPGFYTQQQFDESFKNGHKDGLIRGGIIGLALGLAAMGFICYEWYGPPAQVPNLSLLIGDMRRAKEDCEGMVYSVKNRWRAKIITDADSRIGASEYRDLASRFNGISDTLEAMLSTGHDKQSLEEMRLNLEDAQSRYHAFRLWFDKLPREKPKILPDGHIVSGETKFEGLPEMAIDLAKHFFDGMKEMDKIKRDHLIGMLKRVHFKTWPEISEDLPKQ